MMLSKVDLPAPLRPTRPTFSLGGMVKFMPSKTHFPAPSSVRNFLYRRLMSFETLMVVVLDWEVYGFQSPVAGAWLGTVSSMNGIHENQLGNIRRAKRRCRRKPMKIIIKSNT